MLKIEAGKFYRAEDGSKVGPMYVSEDGTRAWVDVAGGIYDPEWTLSGKVSDPRRCPSPYGPLIAEWTDDDDTPKTWGEMSDAEQAALLLAAHRGKVIETKGTLCMTWTDCEPQWRDHYYYRVKPEPKREKVVIEGWMNSARDVWFDAEETNKAIKDLRITFDTIDGKPDCASIRMEEIF